MQFRIGHFRPTKNAISFIIHNYCTGNTTSCSSGSRRRRRRRSFSSFNTHSFLTSSKIPLPPPPRPPDEHGLVMMLCYIKSCVEKAGGGVQILGLQSRLGGLPSSSSVFFFFFFYCQNWGQFLPTQSDIHLLLLLVTKKEEGRKERPPEWVPNHPQKHICQETTTTAISPSVTRMCMHATTVGAVWSGSVVCLVMMNEFGTLEATSSVHSSVLLLSFHRRRRRFYQQQRRR